MQRQGTIIHDTENKCDTATGHEDSDALNEAAETEEQNSRTNWSSLRMLVQREHRRAVL